MKDSRSRKIGTGVVGAVLALTMTAGLGACASSDESRQAAGPSDAQPAGFGMKDVFGLSGNALNVVKLVLACNKATQAGESCFKTDSARIKEISATVDRIESAIEVNHAETTKRLSQLQKSVDRAQYLAYVDSPGMTSIEANGDVAWRAWEALGECVNASANGAATCRAYNGGGYQDLEPGAGIQASQDALVAQVNQMPSNIQSTVTQYTGRRGEQGRNGLAHAQWVMYKNGQDDSANIAGGAAEGDSAPVIGANLINSSNPTLAYYASLYERWAFLSTLAAGFTAGEAVAAQRQNEFNGAVNGSDGRALSIKSTYDRYFIEPIAASQVLVSAADGKSAYRISHVTKTDWGTTPAAGGVPSYERTAEIANQLATYAPYSNNAKAFGSALPAAGTPWLSWAPTHERTIRYVSKNYYTTTQRNVLAADQSKRCTVGMVLRDTKPTYDGTRAANVVGQENKIDFAASFNRYVTSPAEFVWDDFEDYRDNGRGTVGKGAFVQCDWAKRQSALMAIDTVSKPALMK